MGLHPLHHFLLVSQPGNPRSPPKQNRMKKNGLDFQGIKVVKFDALKVELDKRISIGCISWNVTWRSFVLLLSKNLFSFCFLGLLFVSFSWICLVGCLLFLSHLT